MERPGERLLIEQRTMKNLLQYFAAIGCGILLTACYGLEKEEYRPLAPIEVSGPETTIYAKATETLTLDLHVESGNDNAIAYEWSYGRPDGDFPGMIDIKFISDSPTLDYAFEKSGSYVLRLRIDNGESIGFYYYDLRVQSGFDEGYLLLCNDEEGRGSLAFVKLRTPQEEADNEQEVWDDLLHLINPEYEFRNLNDVYVFSSPGFWSGVLISSNDTDGTIYRLDPASLGVTYTMKSMEEYGIQTGTILGEQTYGSTEQYVHLLGDDLKAYRYELSANMLIYRNPPYPAKYSQQGYFASKSKGERRIVAFCEEGANAFASSRAINGYAAPEGYEFVNMTVARIGAGNYDRAYFYYIAQSTEGSQKQIKILRTNDSFGEAGEMLTYTESAPMMMDSRSRMVTTKLNGNAYYDYDNKIYHWAMTSTSPRVPTQNDRPDITLPEGEQIMDICTNAIPTTSSTVIDDDKLLIATYNPTATGRKPGSLFLYDLRTMTREKEWIGICEKPVALAYKFPTSN